MHKDPQELAEAVGAAMFPRDRNAHFLGIRLDEIRPGYARMSLSVRPEMTNGHDVCHGGIIYTLADTAFAYACNSHNGNALASACSIDYLAPAHPGDTLGVVCEERHLAGRTGVYDAVVTNQDGKRIALFRGKSHRVQGEVVRQQGE
ncbi:MAG: hydroxyphenylacetyl-CoA thioesterase PaaI [Rhodocyclales bacterium]|nr:hydroxyphenylacetyl-CoA thioesterase PaaI [Rhodocyclales bacterium]